MQLSKKDREMIRSDFASWANYLKEKYKATLQEAKNKLLEIFDVSV